MQKEEHEIYIESEKNFPSIKSQKEYKRLTINYKFYFPSHFRQKLSVKGCRKKVIFFKWPGPSPPPPQWPGH